MALRLLRLVPASASASARSLASGAQRVVSSERLASLGSWPVGLSHDTPPFIGQLLELRAPEASAHGSRCSDAAGLALLAALGERDGRALEPGPARSSVQ